MYILKRLFENAVNSPFNSFELKGFLMNFENNLMEPVPLFHGVDRKKKGRDL
jgi:hypothetical protein